MNFLELQDKTRALLTLPGWANSNPLPEYDVLINAAYKWWAEETQYNVEDADFETLENQPLYDLSVCNIPAGLPPREWILINDDMQYNVIFGEFLSGYLPQVSREQLRQNNRNWRLQPSSTPLYWYESGQSNKIGLWPVPNDSNIRISFEGARYPCPLENPDDTPTFNSKYHKGLSYYAACLWAENFAEGDENIRLSGYMKKAEKEKNDFLSSLEAREPGFVVRRVARPPCEYLSAGFRQIPIWPVLPPPPGTTGYPGN